MTTFIQNPTDFAAECRCQGGKCTIVRENFLFLDDGTELTAVSRLQSRCGHVVIIPDQATGQALLYHTSCRRMNDVVSQLFAPHLDAPASLPHSASSEMSLGALYRRAIAMTYDHCRAAVERFGFDNG